MDMLHTKIDLLLDYFEIENPDGARTARREVAFDSDRLNGVPRRQEHQPTTGTMDGVVSEAALARMVHRNQRDLQRNVVGPREFVRHGDSCAVC